MSEELIRDDPKVKVAEISITYYFTLIFTVAGTLAVLFLLSHRVENLSFFFIILSISGGGLPLGIIGVFIDYKVSVYKNLKST